MPETNPPNPSEDPKHPNAGSGDNPTTIIPSIAARPEGLTDEEWALIESRRGNQEPQLAKTHQRSNPTRQAPAPAPNPTLVSAQGDETANSRGKIIAIGIGAIVLLVVAVFLGAKAMGGGDTNHAPKAETTSSAPKVEAIDLSKPITLTNEQISQLEAGGEAANKIFDRELVPRLDAIIEEGIANSGVVSSDSQGISTLTNSAADAEGVANTLGQISQRYSPAGEQQDFAVLDTKGHAQLGSRSWNSSEKPSIFSINNPAEIAVIRSDLDDSQVINPANHPRFTTQIVPVVTGNQLLLTIVK